MRIVDVHICWNITIVVIVEDIGPLAAEMLFHIENRHYTLVDLAFEELIDLVDLVDLVELFFVSFDIAASSARSFILFSAIASGICSLVIGGVIALVNEEEEGDLTGIIDWMEAGF